MSIQPFVYADINCPFCFVLHERLKQLNLIESVEWRLVEHARSANTQELKYVEILNTEFKAVLDKAPDIEIHNPKLVVNTAVINEIICAVATSFPDKAFNFRDALYRVLWVEGKDISDPVVIDQLLIQYGVEEFEYSESSQSQLQIWQADWEMSDYEQKLPVMVNNHHSFVTGLQSAETILSFYENKDIKKLDHSSACNLKTHEKAMLLGDSLSAQVISGYLSHGGYELQKTTSVEQLLKDACEQSFSVILIEYELDLEFKLCAELKEQASSTTPIIYFSDSVSDLIEAQGFSAGMTDMLHVGRQRDSLLGRLGTHVRNKHQLDIISGYATHDPLTGFYNRREIERVLARSWQTACRYKTELTVFIIDVDNLKKYNLKYGYAAGDEALMSISNILASGRSEDIVGRFSGEEFVMILHNTPEKELLKIAKRIQDNVLSRQICYNKTHDSEFVSVSVGIATASADKQFSHTNLLSLAAKALEQAEAQGKNQALKLRLDRE
ncbi:hypothetical protein C1E23_12150 [Pseudoalteromonas phenolica]|uniref:diguanylate cyclase n=1 Tax=Pseudoalteromonas phenolica TaxID=161398 RepID=A0A4Q7IKU8_9GAMM|nr:diguanylate cyclase [Pseudoalteromonas phenolica]RZQ52804.1 hypothetical protein C1E23_12150 [Pseudoalteromonas phenolica]